MTTIKDLLYDLATEALYKGVVSTGTSKEEDEAYVSEKVDEYLERIEANVTKFLGKD